MACSGRLVEAGCLETTGGRIIFLSQLAACGHFHTSWLEVGLSVFRVGTKFMVTKISRFVACLGFF